MNAIKENRFPNLAQASQQLADDLTRALSADIAGHGRATLILPGGTTPLTLYQALGRCALDWQRINLILSDDRQVPITDPRSNAAMLERTLLSQLTGRPRFISLLEHRRTDSVKSLQDTGATIRALAPPAPRLVLGMGKDGHIASLFSLADLAQTGTVIETTSPDGLRRISLGLEALRTASTIDLLISGYDKACVIEAAQIAGSELPIATLLARCGEKIRIYHANDEPGSR